MNPLAKRAQKHCHGHLEAGDCPAFSAALPNIQGCKAKASKALGPHFPQVMDTWVVKAVFAFIGLSSCIEKWDLKAGHGILRRKWELTSANHVLDKGPYVFHWGTYWTLAVLHAHGGFLCQVWFCTFTLLSLLSLLQAWFCSQAFSRACRTSCVLELSGFGYRCQDASNKKNYQVALSKQIEKQLCFTQS